MATSTRPPGVSARARVRRTHAERSQSTQQDLIDAAIRVIAERGLANASTFEIAKAAGVTPGALQHHFASKNELILRAALELVRSDDRDGADALPAATLSPRDADEVDGARRGGGNDGARAEGAARQDQFEVAAPKAVKAHGDDWDDDRDDDDDNDDDDDDDD